MIDYYHGQRDVKCKLFTLTLIGGGDMIWFKTLLDASIDSWKDVCDSFTARKRKAITMALLYEVT